MSIFIGKLGKSMVSLLTLWSLSVGSPAQRIRLGRHLLEKMFDAAVKPDVINYNSVAGSKGEARKLPEGGSHPFQSGRFESFRFDIRHSNLIFVFNSCLFSGKV